MPRMSKMWFLNLALETVDAVESTWIAFCPLGFCSDFKRYG